MTSQDPEQQYALYLPSAYPAGAERVWPVLFVLDPRGRGVPGIERFLPAAERHGFIVVSSYQSRSDTWASVTANALQALLKDAELRFRMDKRRLYLAGMSGTAHAAWRLAQQLGDHAAGVIGCVGGVQEETQGPPGEATFAYYGISAPADFNYQETLRLERHMLEAGIDHRIDFFDGTHGWSPPEHTNRALDWMQLQAVRRGLASPDETLIESELQQALDAIESASDPLERARRLSDLVRDFSGLSDVAGPAVELAKLERSPAYRARRKQEEKLAKREETYYRTRMAAWLRDMQSLGSRAPTLAESKVALQLESLRERAADSTSAPEANSARRILESLYTTVAFSLPQSFGGIDQADRAARSLEVAAEIYPRRPMVYWSLASIYASTGQEERAFEALRRATSLGWVDLDRLKTDPTWNPIRQSPEWAELVASVEQAQGGARSSDG